MAKLFSESTLISIIFSLVILLVIIYFQMRISNLKDRYESMMTDKDGQSFESMVLARLDDIQNAKDDIENLDKRCNVLKDQLGKCVQKVGVVRFNAFDDTGSDLSFAIALLDEKNDGVVISSIYGRSEARCYAKPINNSDSSYVLSDEEKQAIKNSKKF